MKTTHRLLTLALTLAAALPSGFAAGVFPTNDLPPPMGRFLALSADVTGDGRADITFPADPRNILRNLRWVRPDNSMPPPASGTQEQNFNAAVFGEMSTDGGSTFQRFSTTVQVAMSTRVIVGAVINNPHEILQFDLSGGDLPAGVMIRESPTKASTGKTSIQNLGTGGYRIDSFFDIFTELSVDGGATWAAAGAASHLACKAASDENTYAFDFLPPADALIAAGEMAFGNGVSIRTAALHTFDSASPPNTGETKDVNSACTMTMELRTDHGGTYNIIVIQGTLAMRETTLISGPTRFFNTEMLALNLAGGPAPGGVMLRESPTRQSLGRTSVRNTGGDNTWKVASFFDVFVELSLDGGATWMPCLTGPTAFALPMRIPASEVLLTKGGMVPTADQPGSRVPPDALITFIGTPSLNATGDSAVLLKWSSRMSGADAGIFLRIYDQAAGNHGDMGYLAVKGGDPVGLGGPLGSPTIASFDGAMVVCPSDPTLQGGWGLAFNCTLKGAGIDKTNDKAICVVGLADASPRIVAQEGTEMPGVPGGMLLSVSSFATPRRGCVLMTGTLQRDVGGVTSADDACLLFFDARGVGHLVAQENKTIIGGDTVKSFSILKAVPRTPGQTHNHNSKELLWNATFTNGKTGMIHTALPASTPAAPMP